MARHRSTRPESARGTRLTLAVTALMTALVAGPWSVPSLVAPATADDVATVEAQLATHVADEQAAAARVQQAAQAALDAEAELAAIATASAATQTHVTSARDQTGRLAAAAYRHGSIDPHRLHLQQVLAGVDPPTATSTLEAGLAGQDAVLRRNERVSASLSSSQQEQARRTEELRAERDRLVAEHAHFQAVAAQTTAHLAALREAERQRLEAERLAASAQAARGSSREPLPTGGGSCPASGGRGAESRLTPATLSIMRCGLAAFPQIRTAGGWGSRGNATDHDDGRAVDFMIPSYGSASGNDLGWAVAEWARQQPGVDYVMFDSKMWGSWGGGWKSVSNRGSDTANHLDHVHVSVKG